MTPVPGVAAGYESTETDTGYNRGKNYFERYTIAPYLAYLINEIFSFNVSGGYSSPDYETDRIDNINGGIITGSLRPLKIN